MLVGVAKEPNKKENYAYIYVTGTVAFVCVYVAFLPKSDSPRLSKKRK